MKYLLDTHVWIWWNAHPQALSTGVRQILSNPKKWEELLLSPLSVWEFGAFLASGNLSLSCTPEEWIRQALDQPGLRLVPVTPQIAYRAAVLPGSLQEDPVDRILVATAREENAMILTKDKTILTYPHVQSLW